MDEDCIECGGFTGVNIDPESEEVLPAGEDACRVCGGAWWSYTPDERERTLTE